MKGLPELHKKDIERFIQFFSHFSLRLSERYGILISFEDYVLMCHIKVYKPVNSTKKGGNKCVKGIVNFSGREIKVIKANFTRKFNPLITALPLKKAV